MSFDALLGQPATVRLDAPGSPRRFINGIIRTLSKGGQIAGPQGNVTFTRYRAELTPRLWLLSRRVNCRIFQRSTVVEILTRIFQEWKLNVHLELSGTYPKRDYCVQYRETDLAFVSRLMEEEGIWYCFAHTADAHTLVLGDSPGASADLPEHKVLTYDDGRGACASRCG